MPVGGVAGPGRARNPALVVVSELVDAGSAQRAHASPHLALAADAAARAAELFRFFLFQLHDVGTQLIELGAAGSGRAAAPAAAARGAARSATAAFPAGVAVAALATDGA